MKMFLFLEQIYFIINRYMYPIVVFFLLLTWHIDRPSIYFLIGSDHASIRCRVTYPDNYLINYQLVRGITVIPHSFQSYDSKKIYRKLQDMHCQELFRGDSLIDLLSAVSFWRRTKRKKNGVGKITIPDFFFKFGLSTH